MENEYPLLRPKYIQLYRNDAVVKYWREGDNGFRPKAKGHNELVVPETTENSEPYPLEVKPKQRITEFSKKSRRRLAFYASNTDMKMFNLITLTYPEIFPSNGKEVKSHLNHILTKMRQKFKGFKYLWFLEFQERGAPHIHIITNKFVPMMWLSESWYNVVGSEDDSHLKSGTNVQRVRKVGGMARYVVKYCVKMGQKQVPKEYEYVGRLWGCSRSVKPKPVTSKIKVDGRRSLYDILKGWEYRTKIIGRNISILYNATVMMKDNSCLLKKMYPI